MRIALHSVIIDGGIDDYRRNHVTVPTGLRDLFGEAGIHDWTIWRSGRDLFHLVECDDFDAAMRVVNASPVNDAWQADIGRFVQDFHGPDGEIGFTPLERMWTLAEQRAAQA